MAGNNGTYVWKKYDKDPDSFIEITTTPETPRFENYTGYLPLILNSPDVDLTQVDISYFGGMKFYIPNSNVYKKVNTAGTTASEYYTSNNNSTGYSYSVKYEPDVKRITFSRKDINFGSAYVYEVESNKKVNSEFYGYVVDNNQNKYPDGGMVSGYWYKLWNGIPLPPGYTKFAVDKITFTGDRQNATINHSLGVVPRIALLTVADDNIPYPTSNNYYVYKWILANAVNNSGLGGAGIYFYLYTSSSGNISGGQYNELTTFSDTTIELRFADSFPRLRGNIEYTLTTMA